MEQEEKKRRTKQVAEETEVTANPEEIRETSQERQTAPEIIEVPLQEFEEMKQALEQAKLESQEYSDGWRRERADFLNYKKRIERDQINQIQALKGEILKEYLVILDDLERALKNRPTEGEGAKWAEGIELIYRNLQNILEKEGISRIPAENEMFDPNRHEAIAHEDSPDHKSGEVIEVSRQGYLIGDRVLRPAQVKVAK